MLALRRHAYYVSCHVEVGTIAIFRRHVSLLQNTGLVHILAFEAPSHLDGGIECL